MPRPRGSPVSQFERILLVVYTVCGALAGLGGIVTASLLKSGDPKFGYLAELYVIAAVVVGGTSLSGGEGKILGTLIGALFIAVIENGMNLTNVDPFTQMIVFGAVILAAVLLDTLKKRVCAARRQCERGCVTKVALGVAALGALIPDAHQSQPSDWMYVRSR